MLLLGQVQNLSALFREHHSLEVEHRLLHSSALLEVPSGVIGNLFVESDHLSAVLDHLSAAVA